MFWNRYSIENVSSELHENFAPDPRWAVGGSLVRCAMLVVKSSAVPSEPAAPIGAHWSGGGRGQQEGMGGMNLGFSELYAHWALKLWGPARARGHWTWGTWPSLISASEQLKHLRYLKS